MVDPALIETLRPHLKYLEPGADLDVHQPLADLGLDSMAAVDLLFDIEDRFQVVLPDEYLNEQVFATAATLGAALAKLTDTAGMGQ